MDQNCGALERDEAWLPATWGKVLRIWWLLVWRQFAITLTLGVILVIIGVVFAILVHVPKGELFITINVFLWIFSAICNVVVLRMALNKQYAGFRVALVARTPE